MGGEEGEDSESYFLADKSLPWWVIGVAHGSSGVDGRKQVCFRAIRRYARPMQATAYRYLVNLPGVCSGQTIIEGTRIGVHDVVGMIVNGAEPEDVLRSFPDLKKAQIYECLAYYEDHRTEIDALIAEQMSESLA